MDETEGVIVVRRAASDWVYAVRFGGYVKIGSTTDPASRLRGLPGTILKPDDLDTADVEPLCAVPGSAETERLLHLMWAPFRAIGEWFHATDHIVESCRGANTDAQREIRFGLQGQALPRDAANVTF
jgi:hypothetical protein